MIMGTMVAQDLQVLEKFTRFFTLKVIQVVVQSRLGQKLSLSPVSENDVCDMARGLTPSQVHNKVVDWFNIAIPDVPEVVAKTKLVLTNETAKSLSNVIIIEISLKTNDGDEMVLELWTVKLTPDTDPSMTSLSTIYYRMGIILKSALTISRIIPAYKIARAQSKDSYLISYRIYSGTSNVELLGDNYKTIKISELSVMFGTIQLTLHYRTKLAITPNMNTKAIEINKVQQDAKNEKEVPEKKVIDLNKPLTPGAFVDVDNINKLRALLNQKLPPEPSMAWMLADKLHMDKKFKKRTISESVITVSQDDTKVISSSAPSTAPLVVTQRSKAVQVPNGKSRHSDKNYSKMMEFPFADGSPITELACFYQECLAAKNQCDDLGDVTSEVTASSDSDLSIQLKQFEDAVPEFDSMVASMYSNGSGE